ncbi:MAG: hypothetical protein ACXAC5_02440 [Promethearchaeota archaeon]
MTIKHSGETHMIHILILSLSGFVANLSGPGVQITCAAIEEFVDVYGFKPYDFDTDDDVDLADFAVFQQEYNGEDVRMDVTHLITGEGHD